jgi:hypothetical protein
MFHNDTKVRNTLDKTNFIRAKHALYSPDLSPCNFWLIGITKHGMVDRQLQSLKENLDAVTES